jgi:hypothetical protein
MTSAGTRCGRSPNRGIGSTGIAEQYVGCGVTCTKPDDFLISIPFNAAGGGEGTAGHTRLQTKAASPDGAIQGVDLVPDPSPVVNLK